MASPASPQPHFTANTHHYHQEESGFFPTSPLIALGRLVAEGIQHEPRFGKMRIKNGVGKDKPVE
jgi:hypothetical protein